MTISLNHDELVQACKNIGFDLTCGACASQFMTGSSPYEHDDSCSTKTVMAGKLIGEWRGCADATDRAPAPDGMVDALIHNAEHRGAARIYRHCAEWLERFLYR